MKSAVVVVPRAPVYLNALVDWMSQERLTKITKSQAYEVVVKKALEIEAERGRQTKTRIQVSIDDAKKGERAYGRKNLEPVSADVLRFATDPSFGLLRKSEDDFERGSNFETLRRLRSENPGDADRFLLHLFLMHSINRDDPFRPSRFLWVLRNHVVDKLSVRLRGGSMLEDKGTGEEGLAYYDDLIFRREELSTDAPSVTTMTEWGEYFGLIESFNQDITLQGRKVRVKCVFPVRHMASAKELTAIRKLKHKDQQTVQHELGISATSASSVLSVYEAWENKGREPNTTEVLLDFPGGGLSGYNVQDKGPEERTYVLARVSLTQIEFMKALRAAYRRVAVSPEYAHIGEVMRETCKMLRISRRDFSDQLEVSYKKEGPSVISLERGYPKRTSEEFVEMFGASFFYISVGG